MNNNNIWIMESPCYRQNYLYVPPTYLPISQFSPLYILLDENRKQKTAQTNIMAVY